MCPDDPDTHLVPRPLHEGQVEDQLCGVEVEGVLHSCLLWTSYLFMNQRFKSPKPKTTDVVERGREKERRGEGDLLAAVSADTYHSVFH